MSVFIERLQDELATWWEKCYVGEEERKKFLDLQPGLWIMVGKDI